MQKVILVILFFLGYSKANLHGQNNFAFNLKIILAHSIKKYGEKYNSFEFRIVTGVNYTEKWNNLYYSPTISLSISKGSQGSYALYSKIARTNKFKACELLITPLNLSIGTNKIIEYNAIPLHQLSANYASFNNIKSAYLINLQSHIIVHKRKDKYFWQQIGQIQARINNIQFGYYNDGPPFSWICLGDGFDRYITGGGYIKFSITNPKHTNYALGWEFSKFTGYMDGNFKALNTLGFEYLMMKDPLEQSSLSSSNKITFSMNNNYYQGELFIDFRDSRIDIQDAIHRFISKNPVFLNKKYSSNLLGINFLLLNNLK